MYVMLSARIVLHKAVLWLVLQPHQSNGKQVKGSGLANKLVQHVMQFVGVASRCLACDTLSILLTEGEVLMDMDIQTGRTDGRAGRTGQTGGQDRRTDRTDGWLTDGTKTHRFTGQARETEQNRQAHRTDGRG